MRQKLAKLIDVKSIVTLLLTIVFCILSVRKDISSEQYLTIFTTIIAFYFGTQYSKSSEVKKDADNS
jgi:hypothetical protein